MQFGVLEPEADFVLRLGEVAGRVHQVGDGLAGQRGHGLGLVGEVAADRSGLGLVRVGRADDLTHRGDRILPLEDKRDHRPPLHERGRRVVYGRAQPLLEVEVVLAGEVRVQCPHLHADDLQRRVLEALQDTSRQPPHHGIRLQYDERALPQLLRVGHDVVPSC
jgi:ABC-type microcin C transport system duplicated ATPase subunit YejF